MSREIGTGAYWFYRDLPFGGSSKAKAVLVDSIDAEALQTAAQLTMKRYPFLRYTAKKSEDDRQYLLVENDKPFFIEKKDDFVNIDGTAQGAYLWGICYTENRLYLSAFHGLVDGLGIVSVMKAILCFYFSTLTGEPLTHELAAYLEETPDGSEYADPFYYARQCETNFEFNVPEALTLEAESSDTFVPRNFLITVSLGEVLRISKQTEGSVSGIIALIMARAFDRHNSDPEKCVVIQCPISLRPLLGCTETMQNCVTAIKYVYSPRLRKMPLNRQASCFKGMLMIQSSEEFLMNKFSDWKKDVLSFNRETTIAEKRAIVTSWEGKTLPLMTYLGNFTAGEYDKYISSMDVRLDMSSGVGIVATAFKGKLYMRLHMSEKNKSVLNWITDELASLGLKYTVE